MRFLRVLGLLAIVSGAVLAPRAGVAQSASACSPACGSGETCVNDACTTPPHAVLPATSAPAPRPLWHEGKAVMPFMGINSFAGDSGTNLGIGLRLGTLLGSRLSENWSLNAELAFDVIDPNSPPAVTDHQYMLDLAFAPLLHVPQQKLELVVGPILGPWFLYDHTSTSSGSSTVSATGLAIGWALGANAGVLFPVSAKVRMGGLLSFVSRNPVTFCASGTGVTEQCTSSGLHAVQALAFTLAAML